MPVAFGEDGFARGVVGAFEEIGEGAALHFGCNGGASDFDPGGGEIDVGDEFVADGAGLGDAGPFDEKGDVETGIVASSFGAGEGHAVVAGEEDDGVAGEAAGFEDGQELANIGGPCGDEVVVVDEVVTDLLRIGEESGETDFGGIVRGGDGVFDVGAVGVGEADVEKEWLAGGEFVEKSLEFGVFIGGVEVEGRRLKSSPWWTLRKPPVK